MKKCPDCGSLNMDGNYCNECEGDNQGDSSLGKTCPYCQELLPNHSYGCKSKWLGEEARDE